MLWKAAHVNLRGARAVRSAEKIDSREAHRVADLVDMARHRYLGGVEAQVGAFLPFFHALPRQRIDRNQVAQMCLRTASIKVAPESVRSAGAALIEHHDVARPPDRREDAGVELRIRRRRLAGATSQNEERIWILLRLERGKDEDVEGDTPSTFCRSVFEDFVERPWRNSPSTPSM